MLPQYADGSAKKGKVKGKKVKKQMSLCQCCILLLIMVWMVGIATYFYRVLEHKNGPDSGGFIGLVLLGPNSRAGRQWVERCEAFFKGIEDRFPVPGWSDEIENSIGQYSKGKYLEQIRQRELEIAKEVAEMVHAIGSQDLARSVMANDRPIGAVAGSMGAVLETGEVDKHEAPRENHAASMILPEGSYKGSCAICQLMGFAPHQQLRCMKCKDGTGLEHESVIRLDSCKENEWVGNTDGKLSCEPIPEGDPTALVHAESNSCQTRHTLSHTSTSQPGTFLERSCWACNKL